MKTPEITVTKRWMSSDIREMCIRHNWYTAGDTHDYSKMLEYVETHLPADENIYQVASDILEHSSDPELYVEAVMFSISDEVVRTFYSVRGEKEELEAFEEKCYHAYQLDWMLSHGRTLEEAYEAVAGLAAENLEEHPEEAPASGGDVHLHLERAKEAFLYDVGFGNGIFACKEEFLGAEFLDRDYMEHLFQMSNAPEKDRTFWYREYMGLPSPNDSYAGAVEALIEVLKKEGPEAISAFIGTDAPETDEAIRRAILKAYEDMPESAFLQALQYHGIRGWAVSFAIDGRFYANVWAKNQKGAEECAKDCFYDADFGELECVNSEMVHVEDDKGNYLDPRD